MSRARAGVMVVAVGGISATSALACEPPPPVSADGAREPAIASVYRSRCGACHTRVEPGTRSREHLESAFGRHRLRLRLREDQWRDLVAYLAIPVPPSPPPALLPCLPTVPDEKSSP
jgi:hypothetical protein